MVASLCASPASRQVLISNSGRNRRRQVSSASPTRSTVAHPCPRRPLSKDRGCHGHLARICAARAGGTSTTSSRHTEYAVTMKPLAELIGSSPGIRAVRENVERLLTSWARAPASPSPDSRRDRNRQDRARQVDAPALRETRGAVRLRQLRRHSKVAARVQLFGHERGAFTGAQQRAPAIPAAHPRHALPRRGRADVRGAPGTLLTAIEEKSSGACRARVPRRSTLGDCRLPMPTWQRS